MEFRRNGLRDERRRRVLMDETLHAADATDASNTEAPATELVRSPAKPYSEAVIATSQTPVTCVLPKRPYMIWIAWLCGALVIGGIEALYRFAFLASPPELQQRLLALNVLARGSLASWFAGVVLATSAFGSLLVFQIRRHRTDDYRGRYRWWLWLVPLLLLLSVSASTGLHEGLSGGLTALTGAEVAVNGKGWWLIAYSVVFLPVVLQLSLEIWRSRLASFCLLVTVSAYLCVAAFELGGLELDDPVATTMCHSALLLAAHFGVLITVLAYGRYVYLEAHDQLAGRKKWIRWPKRKATSTKKRSSTSTKATKSKQVRVDEPHEKFGKEQPAPTVTLKPARATSDEVDDGETTPQNRKLSKAERRRLKKEAQY